MAVSRAINTFLDETHFAFSSVSVDKSCPFCDAPLVLLKELIFRKFYWEFREGFRILGCAFGLDTFFVNRFVLTRRKIKDVNEQFMSLNSVCLKQYVVFAESDNVNKK